MEEKEERIRKGEDDEYALSHARAVLDMNETKISRSGATRKHTCVGIKSWGVSLSL